MLTPTKIGDTQQSHLPELPILELSDQLSGVSIAQTPLERGAAF
jgi:hypothetical protein